jgi:ComF family protein
MEPVAAVGPYEGVLREAIHGLKYGRRRALAVPLGELLARRLEEEFADWQPEFLTPVPIHWRRRWQRGFNQAELLAEELAQLYGVGVDTESLRRVRHTRSQVGLSSELRRRNLADAFRVCRPESVKGRRVLLVDDVCTTRTTLMECARALRAAGAQTVYGLVLSC